MNKVHIKNHINNFMAESLYRYGYQYDSLETDIYLDFMINKNEKKIILLNTKLFSFISQINVEFENDYFKTIKSVLLALKFVLPLKVSLLLFSFNFFKKKSSTSIAGFFKRSKSNSPLNSISSE